jgi:folate-binding protein YgfZ
LPLLHRVTSNALADLAPGGARATLFCDFRGRLLHRAVVAVTRDGAVWLLRPDAPGAELAAAVDKSVFRDDVQIEDRSGELPITLVRDQSGGSGVRAGDDDVPHEAWTGDGTRLVIGASAEPLGEEARIALLHPRHGHEIVETFSPFEVGLAHEVHLAKGCFTGQEALQRLITYDSVRRRPLHVRLAASPPPGLALDVHTGREKVGVLTSLALREGFAVVRRDPVAGGEAMSLADGTPLEVIAAPSLERPLGRP